MILSSLLQAVFIAFALGGLAGYAYKAVGFALVGVLVLLTASAGALVSGMGWAAALGSVASVVLCYNVGIVLGLVPRMARSAAEA